MLEVNKTAQRISPGKNRGCLKRVEKATGLRYETMTAWRIRGFHLVSYPCVLLWAILDVLAEEGLLDCVLKKAKKLVNEAR